MPRYRVRAGAELAHDGQVLPGGTDLELPRRVAVEIPHLVDEIDAAGGVVPVPPDGWKLALEDVQAHERGFVLEQQRQIAHAALADQRLLVDAAQRAAAEAQAELDRRQVVITAIVREIAELSNTPVAAVPPPTEIEVPASATSATSAAALKRPAKKE